MLGLCPHLVPAEQQLGAPAGSCPAVLGAPGLGQELLSLSLATGSLWG